MIKHAIKKLPKNTFQIDVTVPWKDVQDQYKTAFDMIAAQFELKGYRKGKVPADLAQKHIPRETVYNQLVRSFMPKIYEEVVKKEELKPIISPHIDLKKAKENEDWEIEFKVAEKPAVNLKNYKEAVKKAKSAVPPAILLPGKDEAATKTENDQKILNTSLDALLSSAECEISDLIIEEELNQRLTRLVDDIQRLGITTETYLKSKNTTMDELKQQYTKELQEMYKIEFILMAIADQENITVEQADIDKILGSIATEKDRQAAQQNAYYYASILRKQKTLDYLTSL